MLKNLTDKVLLTQQLYKYFVKLTLNIEQKQQKFKIIFSRVKHLWNLILSWFMNGDFGKCVSWSIRLQEFLLKEKRAKQENDGGIF